MTASAPVDWQLTDTYFVVAHLHYVLIGINVFPVVGAIYYWFPKFTGRRLERDARPLELLGHVRRLQPRLPPDALAGAAGHAAARLHLPGRHGLGRQQPDRHASARSCSRSASCCCSSTSLVSLRRGQPAGPNPWDAPTLEWSVPSPPPPYNFAVIPTVASRHPLWEDRARASAGPRSQPDRGPAAGPRPRDPRHQRARRRARPDPEMPEDTLAPFWLARRAGGRSSPARCRTPGGSWRLGVVICAGRPDRLVLAAPDPRRAAAARADRWLRRTIAAGAAGRRPAGRNSVGWWGMLCLIATESSLFAYLLFSYYYFALQRGPAWLPERASVDGAGRAQHARPARQQRRGLVGRGGRQARPPRPASDGPGAGDRCSARPSWSSRSSSGRAKPFGLDSSSYGSLYFTITGFHMAHVLVGVVVLSVVFVWSAAGLLQPASPRPDDHRLGLLALRRRGLARRLHHLLPKPLRAGHEREAEQRPDAAAPYGRAAPVARRPRRRSAAWALQLIAGYGLAS